MSLRLLHATPRQGAAWVSRAFALFLGRPLAFAALFALFIFAALALLALPYVGALLVLMALPLLGLSYMIATRSALEGGAVHAGQLIEPLRRGGSDAERARSNQLLMLCGLFALASAMVMLLGDVLDGGAFERLQVLLATAGDAARHKELDALLDDPGLRQGLVARLGGTALLSIPFWHAPALVWWHGQGVAQALFSSTLACWRNRGAFLVYGLAWTLTIVLFSLVAGGLFALIGAPQLVGLAAVPAGLMFSTAFYVSLYFSFADSFAADAPDRDGEAAHPD